MAVNATEHIVIVLLIMQKVDSFWLLFFLEGINVFQLIVF
jgi:hypothetical protein